MKRLESSIEKAVITYAKKLEFIVLKLNNPASKGWPDRLFIGREGCHFYIEFKREGEKARKLQQFRIQTLVERGCHVYLVDNVEEGINVIQYYTSKNRDMGTSPISRVSRGDYGFPISGRAST